MPQTDWAPLDIEPGLQYATAFSSIEVCDPADERSRGFVGEVTRMGIAGR
jgi:hypothetical protein